MMDGGGFRKGWNRLELSGLWPQLINSIAVIPYISRKPYMCCTGLSHKTRVRARAEAHYSYREMADHEDNIGIEVLLQTSLEGVPPDAQVTITAAANVHGDFAKNMIFFKAKEDYPEFEDTSLAEKYQLYTIDNTLIPDGHKLNDYGVFENSTLYLREEGVRCITVLWKQQQVDVWVKSNARVGAIIENVWKKLSSVLGLEAGSPDMYDLFDPHSSSGSEGSSTSLLAVNSSGQGPPLPRDKTLEQLEFDGRPELLLREKSRSRAPSPGIQRSSTSSPTPEPVPPAVLLPEPSPIRTPGNDSDSACNHPGKVRISSQKVTSSSFHIAWSPPIPELCIELAWHHQPVETTTGPITAYILEYGESGSDTPPHIIPLSGVVEEYTVTGLKPHTEYIVKVAAENAAGRGPFCEPVPVQTAPDNLPAPTAPPSEVKIVPDSVTSSSFLLTWCPPPVETTNGPITAYILEYGESGSDTPPHIIPLSGVVEEYTVTGLKPHTKYHVKSAAENAAGRGPFCEPVPVQTAPDIPSTPPSEVKIVPDSVTSSSFFLTWCPPPVETTNAPITAYILEYGESGSDTPPHIIPLSGVVEEYTVTGLKPHTEYHVKVAAENAAGRGPFCEQVPVQTAPDKPVAAPENLQLEVSEEKPSIFVSWSPLESQYYNSDSLTGYRVLYTTSSKECKGGTLDVQPDQTSCTLDFLDTGVAYAVSVAAANHVGIGPYSLPSVAIVGAPGEDDDPRIELIVHRVKQILDNLTVVPPSGRDIPVKYRLIYITIMDLAVLPYLVDPEQQVQLTISELCTLLRLPTPSEWYLSKSHGLQVLMSGKSKFQPAVGLSRKKSRKGNKPYFSVGSALSTSLDVDYLLQATKTWTENELPSEPCIVHMRPYTSKVAKITEDVDFGIVEDAELGQQVYQPWYRVAQGYHPVDKATAAEIAALMCKCQAEQVDGDSDSGANVDGVVPSYLPNKLRRKKSMRKAAVKKYRGDITATKDTAKAELRRCMADLPACNGVFFDIKVPVMGTFVPRMKKGVFGVGPKEITYGCYDGDTVEEMTRRSYSAIKCLHASQDSFTVDFGGIEAFRASTPRAFDIMHIIKIYIQQQQILDEQQPANISQCGPAVSSSLLSFHSYPCLTEPDVLNPYWTHEHGGMSSH